MYWVYVARLGSEGYKKLLEASPVYDRPNASWLQDTPLLANIKSISDGGSTSGIT